MNKSPTIPILYNGGSYGTFAEWALNYFSGRTDVVPFNPNGNSHQFDGNYIEGLSAWLAYCVQPAQYRYVRFHHKTSASDSVTENIRRILSTAERAVILYPDGQHMITNINNKFEKIWSEGWEARNESAFAENLAGWNKQRLQDLEIWERREFLSLYLWSQHLSEVDPMGVYSLTDPNLFKITLADLFDRFELTIRQLLDFCGEPVIRTNFDEIFQQWYSVQHHVHKDDIVDQIVSSTVRSQHFDWSDQNLTLVDEAMIQIALRDIHKLDLLCYNVNVFPSNTHDLRKLLNNV